MSTEAMIGGSATLGAGAGVAAIAWSAASSPAVLCAATVVSLVVAAAAYVRARPTYGARRHLPPGSLGLSASLDAISEEDFYARAARRWGPVFKMSQFHRPVVCVADLELGLELIRTEAASLEQLGQPWGALIPGGYIEFMDGPRHEHYRDVLRRPLNASAISASTDEWVATIRQELSFLAGNPSADLDASLVRMTSALLLRVFFGVVPDSPEGERLLSTFAEIDRCAWLGWRVPPQPEADVAGASRVVRELAETGHDRVSVLSELVRLSPGAVDDPTVVGNLVLMVQNGRLSLAALLRWLLKLGGDHPEWLRELRREHESGGDAVASQFVRETLRLWQSEYAYRRTRRECWIGEHRIPRGWLVRVCLREAHARADVFPDPAAFDPARFSARRYSKHEYAPFSAGPHACLGAVLTNSVSRAFLHELAGGFDLRTVADGRPEHGNRLLVPLAAGRRVASRSHGQPTGTATTFPDNLKVTAATARAASARPGSNPPGALHRHRAAQAATQISIARSASGMPPEGVTSQVSCM